MIRTKEYFLLVNEELKEKLNEWSEIPKEKPGEWIRQKWALGILTVCLADWANTIGVDAWSTYGELIKKSNATEVDVRLANDVLAVRANIDLNKSTRPLGRSNLR